MLPKHLAATTFALLLPLVVACAPETSSPSQMAARTSPFSGQGTNLSAAKLELLVGRIALYPDDLLAIVLPASTQPLQVADAQRFLALRKADAGAQPPKTWDPSVGRRSRPAVSNPTKGGSCPREPAARDGGHDRN